ncbi:hypothetical protein ACWDRR_33140 [Kitasatospora sp. NPDC003701]
MIFQDHLRALAERTISSISAAEAMDIYVISFFIDNEDDDPRQPTLTIGYNTETQVNRPDYQVIDPAAARWNYAFWLQNQLAVIGDLAEDPNGAAARQEWITEVLHELEYYEGIARRTETANPPGLADDFTAWVRNG